MPHYADGTEAKVGDQVVGVLFNSGPTPKAGTIISITPGVESCNAMVQYTQTQEAASDEPVPRMAVLVDGAQQVSRMVRGEQHGSSGPAFHLWTCADYCDTKSLTKVG